MAPSGQLDVKSESWLNLTADAQFEANLREQRRHNQWRAASQQSASFRRRREQSSDTESVRTVSNNNQSSKNEHLLIRLRQQSYLSNNSNSTSSNSNRCCLSVALSSNLSNSTELDPSLVGGASATRDKLSVLLETDFGNEEELGSRSSSSLAAKFGWPRRPSRLKLLRTRLGRRSRWSMLLPKTTTTKSSDQQQEDPRAARRVGAEGAPSSEQSEEPASVGGAFGRSLSSLSVRLSGKLDHLTHSCKRILFNYNRYSKQRQSKQQGEVNGSETRAAKSLLVRAASEAPRASTGRYRHQDRDHQALFGGHLCDKSRRTNEWVARHHGGLHFSRAILHAQPQNGERPKSLDWTARRACESQAAADNNELKLELELSSRNSIIRGASDSSDSHLSRSSKPQLTARDSSSSTTLVSHSQLLAPAASCTRSSRDSLASSAGSNLNLSRKSRTARGAGGQQKLLISSAETRLQTSDYWSTVTSKSDYSKRQQLQQVKEPKGSKELEAVRVNQSNTSMGALPDAIRMLNSSGQQQQMMIDDQDYYLDVASSLIYSQQQPGGRRGQLIASAGRSPALIAVDDADEQQQPALLANVSHMSIAADFGASGRPAQLQLHRQQQLAGTNIAQATIHDEDYDDYAVPADESCRLERSQVELVQMIGEGQKGYVFLGKLQSKDGRQVQDVAIKTLKYETEQLIDKLMREAAMMRQLEHPHIIRFIGVCPETPALIAMELAELGQLKQYLKLNKHLISVSQLVLFTFQISTALSYLESKQYVHRDVAARNVLVCAHNCVKLADFGLSRNLQPQSHQFQQIQSQIQNQSQGQQQCWPQQQQRQQQLLMDSANERGNYVAASRGKLPVRWLAPESLAFRRFTSASDVWMFAVCSWEMLHFGQVRPWAQIRNNQVLLAIESGQRLPPPPNCPSRLYQLMLQCWSYAPVQRPKFRDLKQQLWSVYLNEKAREQLELEQQQRQRLLAASQREQRQQQQQYQQDRLVLLMSSATLAARQQQQHQRSQLQAPVNQQHQQQQQRQRQIQQQMIQQQQQRLSASPLGMTSTNYTSNVSGYSSAVTAELSNNSSRSSSMGSLARQQRQQQQQQLQQQRAGWQTALLEQEAPTNSFPELSKELGSATKAMIDSNMRRFQRKSPGHVLQKQRSQGSIVASKPATVASEQLGPGGGSANGRQFAGCYDDDVLLAGCLGSRSRRPLSSPLRGLHAYRYPAAADDVDDEEDDSEATSSSSDACDDGFGAGRSAGRPVPLGSSAAEFARQMRLVRPTSGGQTQQDSQPASRQQKATYEGRSQSGAASKPAGRTAMIERPQRAPTACMGDGSSSAAATARASERQRLARPTGAPLTQPQMPPVQPQAQPQVQATTKSCQLAYSRQSSAEPLSEKSQPATAADRLRHQQQQQLHHRQSKSSDPEVLQRLEEQRQLALHQRLLGHIRPASRSTGGSAGALGLSSADSKGRPMNLEQLSAGRQRDQSDRASSSQQLEQRTSVERVDQSLQILESLIADERLFSSNEGNHQHPHLQQQQQQQQHILTQGYHQNAGGGVCVSGDFSGTNNNIWPNANSNSQAASSRTSGATGRVQPRATPQSTVAAAAAVAKAPRGGGGGANLERRPL